MSLVTASLHQHFSIQVDDLENIFFFFFYHYTFPIRNYYYHFTPLVPSRTISPLKRNRISNTIPQNEQTHTFYSSANMKPMSPIATASIPT
jgi:hypothetical protein